MTLGMTGRMNVKLSTLRSTDGVWPCTCDHVADASCACRNLAGAVNVTLAKSAVYASYPLQYVQTFNYKPYEVRWRTAKLHCVVEDSLAKTAYP